MTTLRLCTKLAAAVLALLCVPLLAYAQKTLTIQVIDCNNDPISSVTVTLTGPTPPTSDPSISKGGTSTTNADGILEFSDLLGSYTVSVACPGGAFSFVFQTETGEDPTLVIRCCPGQNKKVDSWIYVGHNRIPYEGGTSNEKKEWERPFGILRVHVMDCNGKDLSGKMVTLNHPNATPPPSTIPLRARPTANGYVTYRMLTARNNYSVDVNCPPLFTTPLSSPVIVHQNGTTTVDFKCPSACGGTTGWRSTIEEWEGHRAFDLPGRGRSEFEVSELPPSKAPAGSDILATPVAFTGGTLTGVVRGPDGRPVKNLDLTITGTVESKAKTDEEGHFTIPVTGAVGSVIKVAGAGIATAAVVRIVETVGQAASSSPPAFVQPGEHVHLSGSYRRVRFQQNQKVVETPVATASGPKPEQALTTFETPQAAQAGEATWKTESPNGVSKDYKSNVFHIANKQIDDQSLRSGQNAKFSYEFDFGQTMAGREVEIGWTITGAVVLLDAAPKRVRIRPDGHASAGGQVKARAVAPGTSEPFTITPVIKATDRLLTNRKDDKERPSPPQALRDLAKKIADNHPGDKGFGLQNIIDDANDIADRLEGKGGENHDQGFDDTKQATDRIEGLIDKIAGSGELNQTEKDQATKELKAILNDLEKKK